MNPALTRALHDWLPPRTRAWLVRRFGGIRVAAAWPAATQGGWADAAEDAAGGFRDGVARIDARPSIGVGPAEDLASLTENSRQFHDRLLQLAVVVARVALRSPDPRILDFGGSFGTHALAVKRLLPNLRFEYTVAELPSFCELGPSLNPDVRFVAGLDAAGGGYHLVYASSSVQYSEDWRALVARLCSASAGSLFITRTPIVFDAPAYVTIQRAYGTEYPGWVLNYQELVDEVTRQGFGLEEVFVNGHGIPVRSVSRPNMHVGLLFAR